MTKYLIVDTETNGLFRFDQPADAEGQPRMAQFGAIFLDDIGAEPTDRLACYIKPNGWVMSEEASAVNGLTTQFLHAHGTPVEFVLDRYREAIDDGYVVVAFNAQFDCKVLRAELRRAGRDDMFERTPNICVMRPLTDLLKLPRKTGKCFKFPTLAEACTYFGIENTDAHDALGDAEAALAILRCLHGAGRLPEPAVHFAREKA